MGGCMGKAANKHGESKKWAAPEHDDEEDAVCDKEEELIPLKTEERKGKEWEWEWVEGKGKYKF